MDDMTMEKHHPDLHRTVMYNGMICRIIGVTFSTRNSIGGWRYSVIPDGERRSLEYAIHDITVDELAFDPPMGGESVECTRPSERDAGYSSPANVSATFCTVQPFGEIQLVKG